MEKYQQLEFHQPQGHWVDLEPGIMEMVLNHDSETGRRTTLQKWVAGACNANSSLHAYCEEIILLDGDFRVAPGEGPASKEENQDGWWEKGCYAFRKPGMLHGPFESKSGCLMFIVCTPAGSA
jgi:hypothetical protein